VTCVGIVNVFARLLRLLHARLRCLLTIFQQVCACGLKSSYLGAIWTQMEPSASHISGIQQKFVPALPGANCSC
jgi:hypothetical protein